MEVYLAREAALVVRAQGEVDLSNTDELSSALSGAADESPDGFVIDLSAVSYIDGTGTRAIVAAWDCVRANGGRVAVVPSGIAKRVFYLLGLDRLPCFSICDDIGAAMSALSDPGNDENEQQQHGPIG